MGKTGISGVDRKHWILKAVRREGTAVFLSREAKLSELMLHRWRDLVVTGSRERLKGGVSSERVAIEYLKMEIAGRECVVQAGDSASVVKKT